MAKVRYDNITFDSDLEVEYYKHLKEQGLDFIYHPKSRIYINSKNTYTPDFIVQYDDRVEIIETKGYNQYSFMRDNMIHNCMLEKSEWELIDFVNENGIIVDGRKVEYKKIKYLKDFGWVDFDFKNPNTLSNKRKNKIIELEEKLKALTELKKKDDRYFSYLINIKNGKKLTKTQQEWKNNFEKEKGIL